MESHDHPHRPARAVTAAASLRLAALMAGAAVLAACVPATTGGHEGIGYRQARFEEITAMREYRSCVDDAMQVAEDARRHRNPAAYRTSAQVIEKCEAELGPEAGGVAREERMRAYATGILNYVKAGDIQAAQVNLEKFRTAFAGDDLYLPNGTSFLDTMTLVTRAARDSSSQELTMLNVGRDLRMEAQRVRFWKRN